jgi:vacuolar-type H+-ATPase subunit F/Vma7
MCAPTIEKYGASPANIQWTVVRGNNATLKVEFFEDDETTVYDTDGWTYLSTAYDPTGEVLDELTVTEDDGYAIISIPADIATNWGTQYKSVVSELQFDLQVTIPGGSGEEDTIWTPVIGTICVLGNVTPGGSL